MPLRGYAYVARKKALRIPPNMAVTGRALVVAPYGAVLNDGVQLTGPMVIFSFSDIVVGQGGRTQKGSSFYAETTDCRRLFTN